MHRLPIFVKNSVKEGDVNKKVGQGVEEQPLLVGKHKTFPGAYLDKMAALRLNSQFFASAGRG